MRRLALLAAAMTVLGATGCKLGRPADPVVVRGSQLPALHDVPAGDIVAFRWVGGWDQVPVQVDERKTVDLAAPYGFTRDPVGVETTFYADPDTSVGADEDSDLDGDDEVVFMSKDAGLEAPEGNAAPPGVVAGSGLKLYIRTPYGFVEGDGWLYLYRRTGNLDPAAGEDYVDYSHVFGGPTEDSTVDTPFYEVHFIGTWIRDRIRVKADDASAVDILDRAKVRLVPGNCTRSEETFGGPYVADLDGPVRAIRSYMGANSGPFTQREHLFYEQREDVRTILRVHAVPGVLDYFDYSAAASGMTYRNNHNTDGVTIDGTPDTPTAGELTWESVDGPQGGLSMVHRIDTDIPGFAPTSYYLDDGTPDETQCTGDAESIGASGPWVNHVIPNTDPWLQDSWNLRSTRTIYYEPPGKADGAARARHVASPLLVTASSP